MSSSLLKKNFDLSSEDRARLLKLAQLGSDYCTPNQKLKMLMAREMLRYVPPTGRYGGVRAEISREVGKSPQYVHQVLWPNAEESLFASDGTKGYAYWQIWMALTDLVFPSEEPPDQSGMSPERYATVVKRWEGRKARAETWMQWKSIIDMVAAGKQVVVKDPGVAVARILQNRMKHLGIKFDVDVEKGYPHTYTFLPK